MENNKPGTAFRPVAAVFLVITLLVALGRTALLEKLNLDYRVALVGNLILFLATAFSFYLYAKSLRNNNAHLFVRMMYSSLLVKMMLCLVSVLLYLFFVGKDFNKAGILACLFFYLVYTWLEVKILMRLSKNPPKNG